MIRNALSLDCDGDDSRPVKILMTALAMLQIVYMVLHDCMMLTLELLYMFISLTLRHRNPARTLKVMLPAHKNSTTICLDHQFE